MNNENLTSSVGVVIFGPMYYVAVRSTLQRSNIILDRALADEQATDLSSIMNEGPGAPHYSAHGRPLQLAGTVGSRPIPLHQLPLGEADGSQTGGDPESVSLAPWLHLCARVCALFIEEGMKSRIDHAR